MGILSVGELSPGLPRDRRGTTILTRNTYSNFGRRFSRLCVYMCVNKLMLRLPPLCSRDLAVDTAFVNKGGNARLVPWPPLGRAEKVKLF